MIDNFEVREITGISEITDGPAVSMCLGLRLRRAAG